MGARVRQGRDVTNNGNTNTLYFTAGAVREQGGVFGFLTAAATAGE